MAGSKNSKKKYLIITKGYKEKKDMRNEISDLKKILNEMHDLKTQACTLDDDDEKANKISLIENTIHRTNSDLMILREKQSKETSFRARANWFDQGEKR